MKRNDTLYCHTKLIMDTEGKQQKLTFSKEYLVSTIDEKEIKISNDDHEEHFFSLNIEDDSYYGIWLTTNIRSLKLKQIEKCTD